MRFAVALFEAAGRVPVCDCRHARVSWRNVARRADIRDLDESTVLSDTNDNNFVSAERVVDEI